MSARRSRDPGSAPHGRRRRAPGGVAQGGLCRPFVGEREKPARRWEISVGPPPTSARRIRCRREHRPGEGSAAVEIEEDVAAVELDLDHWMSLLSVRRSREREAGRAPPGCRRRAQARHS